MNEKSCSYNIHQLRLKTDEITEEQAKKQILAVKKGFEILQKKNGVMLADDVGMGKTFEALGLVFLESYHRLKYAKAKRIPRVLVIVPSTALKIKWEKDVQKFFQKCVKEDKIVNIIKKELSKPRVVYSKGDFRYSREKLVICSINTLFDNPLHRRWDIVVIDEAHKFKNKHTKRYALFDNLERKDVEPILHGKFQKLILMTATPFQLQPKEIINLLSLIVSAHSVSKDKEKLKSDLNNVKDTLNEYQARVQSFERSWKDIPYIEAPQIEQLNIPKLKIEEVIKERLHDPNFSGSVKKALALFLETKSLKEKLESSLASFLIRNSKPMEYRIEIVGSLLPNSSNSAIQLTSDEELFYLLVNKFLYEVNKHKRTFTVQVLQETTSSYATLDKYSISSQKRTSKLAKRDIIIKHYRNLVTKAIESFKKVEEHPKIRELKLNLGLRSNDTNAPENLPSEKTLIFCRFIETASVIKKETNKEFRRIISKSIPQEIQNAFRKKYPRKIFLKGRRKPKTVKAWRFSKRFENLLKRGRGEIFALLDSLYSTSPNFKRRIQEEALFRTYTKQGIRKYWKGMGEELENVIRSKLKEEYFLFLIMKGFQEKSQGKVLTRQDKTRIMREAVEEIFKEKLYDYLKREIEDIEKNFHVLSEDDVVSRITRLIEGLRRQDFAEVLSGETKSIFQGRLIEAFNTKFNPMVLIVTQIGQEGIDLQKECSKVIHYDLWWNPAVMEQRVGRVDRIGSKISREPALKLEVYTPFIKDTVDEDIFKIVKEREKWFKLIIGSKYAKESKLFGEKVEKEATIVPLPASIYESLKINLEPN